MGIFGIRTAKVGGKCVILGGDGAMRIVVLEGSPKKRALLTFWRMNLSEGQKKQAILWRSLMRPM